MTHVPAPARSDRLPWLDGVRAGAALFVLLHHVWLTAFPGFPRNTGPAWLGWALYGHLAVAVFIVVSGFSLALVPLGAGRRLPRGAGEFFRRRAWRILPPYWAALALSVVVVTVWTGAPAGGSVGLSSVVVYGLLLQDVLSAAPPNGVFWSIAVEWQIYFLFPLVLLIARRCSLPAAAALGTAAVLVADLLARSVPALSGLANLTPQFLALFTAGVLAAGAVRAPLRQRQRRAVAVVAAAAGTGLVVLAVIAGSTTIVEHYFWVDLGVGGVVAATLAVLASGGAARARAVLGARPAVLLGRFSYSTYLVHAPLLALSWRYLVGGPDRSPLASFALLLSTAPLVVAGCYLFFLLFERPFLRPTSWRQMADRVVVPGQRRPATTVAPPAAAVQES